MKGLTSDLLDELFQHNNLQDDSFQLDHVTIDSRIKYNNSLFIPLVGKNNDGHDYIEEAIDHGAIATLWDKRYPVKDEWKKRCTFFYVTDTTAALQALAKQYRKEIKPIVIGITGSNGKTTTKDLVSAVLNKKYKTHKTEGNYNNHIGLPLTILSMPSDIDVLVLEMGMNDFHEIQLLSEIAQPDYAIITNIGESHIEYLGSRQGIAEAKLEILFGLKQKGTIIIDGDEPLLSIEQDSYEVITCSFNNESSVYKIEDVKLKERSTSFKIKNQTYRVPLLGSHHAKNATYAIAIGKLFAIEDEYIQQGLLNVQHTSMRFEQLKGIRNSTIINDAYNASPTSMIGAIEVIKQMDKEKMKVLVLGDIFELGEKSNDYHRKIAEKITPPIDVVITIGNYSREIYTYLKQINSNIVYKHAENKKQVYELLYPYLQKNTVVLFKASRGMALEEIVEKITK